MTELLEEIGAWRDAALMGLDEAEYRDVNESVLRALAWKFARGENGTTSDSIASIAKFAGVPHETAALTIDALTDIGEIRRGSDAAELLPTWEIENEYGVTACVHIMRARKFWAEQKADNDSGGTRP
jgi:hypothetical protein